MMIIMIWAMITMPVIMIIVIFSGVVTLCSAPSNPPLLHHPHSKGDHEDTNKDDDYEAIGQGQTNRLGEIQNLSLGRCLLCRPPKKILEKVATAKSILCTNSIYHCKSRIHICRCTIKHSQK